MEPDEERHALALLTGTAAGRGRRGPRVGLVLGAGGMAGRAFHAGALAGLAEHTGWEPRTAEVLVGTSAGSITASLLRAGLGAQDLAADLLGEGLTAAGTQILARRGPRPVVQRPSRRTWLRPPRLPSPRLVARAVRTPWAVPPSVLAAAVLPAGQVPGAALAAGMRNLMGDDWPSEPLWITAVRLSDGHRAVLGRDPAPRADVATAITASCAIPGYFAPVEISGEQWVDGGVHSPTNADLLAERDLDVVVVVASMSGGADLRRMTPDVLLRRRFHRLLRREVRPLRRRGTPVLVVEPTATDLEAMGLNPMQHTRMPEVVRQARRSVLASAGRVSSG